MDPEVVDKVLSEVNIISGTDDEYDILIKKLEINTYEDLKLKYDFEMMLIKQGDRGATLYDENGQCVYSPKEIKISHDTTGCGDTFNAGIILSMSKDIDSQRMLQKAVEMATQVAYEGFNLEKLKNI